MFIILLAVGVFLLAGCQALDHLPNARFLGMGYNAMTRDPDNNLHDPGFTFEFLEFTWENNIMTSDRRYLVPDNILATQSMSCGLTSETKTVFGARSYQDALSTDVPVEVGAGGLAWSARFSASVGYQRVNQETSQNRRIYTSSRAKCIHYELSVNYVDAPVTLMSNFERAVRSLPLVRDDSAYIRFINTYGTHFTKLVLMGAKMVIRSEFDETALTKMEEEGLSIEVGAQASFMCFNAGVESETETSREQREQFENSRRTYSASYLGSQPTLDGRWETWAQTTANSPYPVEYELAPLTELFAVKFFPDMPSSDLSSRRDLLIAAYDTYCSGIEGCGVPPPDRIPVRMTKAVSTFINTRRVYCSPPSYNLVSCGIRNVQAAGGYDMGRYARPVNTGESERACQCKDSAQAVCVAWCANTAVNFTTVAAPFTETYTNATCPAGYKVCINIVFSDGH